MKGTTLPLLFAVVAAACGPVEVDDLPVTGAGRAPTAAMAAQPARFSGGAPSLGALADGVVSALARGDSLALESFRVTEAEHNHLIWPELPIAQQEDHPFPVGLAWENIEIQNAAGVRRVMDRLGGEDLRSGGISCSDEREYHPSFSVLRDCHVVVVTPDGRFRPLQLFASVVVRDGRYKIIRYRREIG